MTDRLRIVESESDWERVLSAAAVVQQIVPDAILVGGSAAALYAKHRFSADDDHVVEQLKPRFEKVLYDLEEVAGWTTKRLRPPVLILGRLEGVDTGIRQLRRSAPLETTTVEGSFGTIAIPTLPEMLRIKAWLVVSRNATRDYLDTVALADKLGATTTWDALQSLDALYPQASGASVVLQLARQMAEPKPFDLEGGDLSQYRGLGERWRTWAAVSEAAGRLAVTILAQLRLDAVHHPTRRP